MEDDDEFGDLYTDVLRPLQTSLPSQPAPPQSRPIDLKNSFSDSNSAMGIRLNASIEEKIPAESGAPPGTGGFDLDLNSNLGVSRIAGGDDSGFGGKVLEKSEGVKLPGKGSGGVDFMEDDDDLNIVVEERDAFVDKPTDLKSQKENVPSSAERDAHFMSQTVGGEMDAEQMIPGLSGKLENSGVPNFDDEWESDESEDDLQIVLNDNHGPMGMDRMTGVDNEDDEDGEPLVIVAGNGDTNHHHHQPQLTMDEQEWAGEEGACGAEGEKKELGDVAKASGGGMAAPAAAQPKLGYSNHMYHHPFHSQFKVASCSVRTSIVNWILAAIVNGLW